MTAVLLMVALSFIVYALCKGGDEAKMIASILFLIFLVYLIPGC